MKPTLPRDYFDALYQRNSDPWNFATKPYEQQKYAATLRGLPRQRYPQALELGCSIGVLSALLAPRCERLLCVDAAQIALDQARKRCAALPNIEFRRATLPSEFPAGKFDLILLSEVGYYFAPPDLQKLQERIISSLNPEGDLVLVHYLPSVPDYPLTGDQVHDSFAVLDELKHCNGFREERYRFDAWRKE